MLWNLCNMLKCNLSKTEIINFSSRFSPAEPICSSKVADHYVQPTIVLSKTLESRLIHTSPLFPLSTTPASRSFAFVSFCWQNQKISFASGCWAHCPFLRFIEIGLLLVIVALWNSLSWNWETSEIAEYRGKINCVHEEDLSHHSCFKKVALVSC